MAAELGFLPEQVERVRLTALLHDVGKIGVSDAVLRKPGKLTDNDWEEMPRHPEIGARLLPGDALSDIRAWVIAHHERPDGKGYPRGLVADMIALEARILAVADAYEAMIADRPYRPGMPANAARGELLRCSGTQFDPEVVRAFVRCLDGAESLAA
jgi:HD-GYP domain-containing protein (c-di-GMP phosphodiesterase class II)